MDGEMARLEGEFPAWQMWRWAGHVYARRLKTSPPQVVRAATVPELRAAIRAKETAPR